MTGPSQPDAVLEHIGPGADIIVPLANGEPVSAARRHRGPRRSASTDVRVHQMHALHDRPYLHGAFGDRLRHVSYFLSHVTRPVLPRRHDRPRAEQLQRDARPPPRAHHATRSSSPPRRRPTATATSASASNADYVASFIGRARFFLEANAQHAAHVRAQPDPRQPGRSAGSRSTARWSRCRRRRATELDDRIAALVAERIPDGATIQTGIGVDPQRHPRRPRGPPRPRRAHRADLRRRDGPRRARRRQRRRQAAQPHQDRRHVRPRHAAACTTSSTRTRRSSCGR